MLTLFYVAGAVAVAASSLALTRRHPVHALLYLVVSFLAVAMVLYSLGAPFVAAVEVSIYAGAIMVLFLFAVMMLNMGPRAAVRERRWVGLRSWIGPGALMLILIGELGWVVLHGAAELGTPATTIGPQQVSAALFGPYLAGVELASLLLLAGLIGAHHLARRRHQEGGNLA